MPVPCGRLQDAAAKEANRRRGGARKSVVEDILATRIEGDPTAALDGLKPVAVELDLV